MTTICRMYIEHIGPRAIFGLFQQRIFVRHNVGSKNEQSQSDGNQEERAGHYENLGSLGEGAEDIHRWFCFRLTVHCNMILT